MSASTQIASRPNRVSANRARARLLQMHYESKTGHIGGNLSALDAILHLHVEVMSAETCLCSQKVIQLERFTSPCGRRLMPDDALKTFHKDGTTLAGHPIAGWHDRIAFATGSLGHGLGLAAGAALGTRLRGDIGTVYCLLSDGECEEGSIWRLFCSRDTRNLPT